MAESAILDDRDGNIIEEIAEASDNDSLVMEIQDIENSETGNLYTRETNSNKRGRDEDLSDEEWQTVGSRRLKKKDVEIIQLSVTCKDKFPKQFALAKLLKAQNIKGISRVKFINPYKLFINFSNEEDTHKFTECEEFKKLGWRCQKTWEVGVSYGLLRNIDIELKEEELLEVIKSDTEVISVKRLNRRIENGWAPCESVRIGFVGSKLPTFIYIYDLRVKIDTYVFPVTQCTQCWRYGHVKNLCPSLKPICPKCSGRHENCDTTTFKCSNCGGKHMAIAKICPNFIKEKKIRELMSQFNVTYRRALTMYIPPLELSRNGNTNQIFSTSNSFHGLADHHEVKGRSAALHASPTRALTYADAVASPAPAHYNSPILRSRTVKKNKVFKPRQPNIDEPKVQNTLSGDMIHTDISGSSSDADENCTTTNNDGRRQRLISFKELIQRLKELILTQEGDLVDRLKSCFILLKDWVMAYVRNYTSDFTVVKMFLSLFNG